MNFAGLAAGYGGIVEGEQDYADRQARNVRTQQGNMDSAIRLRQMREMDASRKAQLEIGRQAPEEYAPITPGTTGYADADKVAPAAPAPAPSDNAVVGTPSTNNVPTAPTVNSGRGAYAGYDSVAAAENRGLQEYTQRREAGLSRNPSVTSFDWEKMRSLRATDEARRVTTPAAAPTAAPNIAPAAAPAPRAAPTAAQGNYTTERGAAAAAQGNMGADPASIRRELNAATANLNTVTDEPSKVALRKYIADLQRQGARIGGIPDTAPPAPPQPASVMAKLGVQTPTVGPGVNQALPNALPATPAVAPEASYRATEIVDLSPRAAGLAQKRMEMLGRERQTYVGLMQASYDPGEQLKLRQAILGIDAGMAAADLTQLASSAAYGSREALVTLAQTTANQIGSKISVQDAGEGRVVLTVAGRQQPPVTVAQASRQFHLTLSEELQKTVATAEAKNHAEAMKQGYQGQREIAVEGVRGQNARLLESDKARNTGDTKVLESILRTTEVAAKEKFGENKFKMYRNPNDPNDVWVAPETGQKFMRLVPGVRSKNGQFTTEAEWEVVEGQG